MAAGAGPFGASVRMPAKYTYHALKLIKPLIVKVGVVRFHALIDEI